MASEVHDWPGGHLHSQGPSRVVIGPRWRWAVGDRVRLPDGRVVKVVDYAPPSAPIMKGTVLVPPLRLVDGVGRDGIMLAEVVADG